MNDISHATSTNASVNLFADDTSLFVSAKTPASLKSRLQAAVTDLGVWFGKWALSINQAKSALLILCGRNRRVPFVNVLINGSSIPLVDCPTASRRPPSPTSVLVLACDRIYHQGFAENWAPATLP